MNLFMYFRRYISFCGSLSHAAICETQMLAIQWFARHYGLPPVRRPTRSR